MIKKMNKGLWVLHGVMAFFLTVFVYYLLTTDIFIANSTQNLWRVATAAINPRLDLRILQNILNGYQNTFMFSVVGLCAGVFIGLLLSYFSLRFRRFRIGKVIAMIFRSTHEVVFMYILVLIFGLNPYIAVFAIGISFGGIMGKIFTDNMNLADDKVFLSYRGRGYSYRDNVFFNLFPNSFNSNLNYVVYRFECAIRSSIVLSYIGLPGIGFYINNAMNDADYNSLFTYLYSLILFVLLFSFLSSLLLKKIQYKTGVFLKCFFPLAFLLCAIFTVGHIQDFLDLFQPMNLNGLVRSGNAILNILNPFNNGFYNMQNMLRFMTYTWQTVVLGILATVFLLILFILLILHYFYGFVKGSRIHLKINDAVSIINRSIPEVVFLVILLFVMRPNVITGALALALHNFGILVKLIKDRIESNYSKLFTAYKNRGYKSSAIFCFIFLPALGRDLFSLVSYRFEMMIKSSAVIGILGSGGLGLLLRLEMSRFNYEAIYFIVIIYIVLFLILDKANSIISR